jgi:hypothetical protein
MKKVKPSGRRERMKFKHGVINMDVIDMEVKIKQGNEMLDATIEMVDGMMIVSPKVDKFVPKDGDVVTVTTETVGNYTCFFKGYVNGDVYSYCGLNNLDNMLFGDILVCCSKKLKTIYPATEEEKQKLFYKLKEEGWEWKEDTKEFVKLKWKPRVGERFYYPANQDHSFKTYHHAHSTQESLELDKDIKRGWCFKTREECKEFCDRLNEAINSVKP